jgi:outer membrane lipoprotein SlyB
LLIVFWSTIFGSIAGAILLPVIVSSLRKTKRVMMIFGLLVGGLLGGELSYLYIENYMSLYGPNASTVGEEFWVFLCSTILGAIAGALLPVLVSSLKSDEQEIKLLK